MKPLIVLSLAFILLFSACTTGSEDNKDTARTDSITELSDAKMNNDTTELPEQNNETAQKPKADAGDKSLIKLSEMKNGQKIAGLLVSDYMYKPRDEYNFSLKGEIQLSGSLSKDPMWDEMAFTPDKKSPTDIRIQLDGWDMPLIAYFTFKNSEKVKNSLGLSDLELLQEGKSLDNVKIVIKNYSHGGKFDGYAESRAEFVKFVP